MIPDKYLLKIKNTHADKYDYSKSNYINSISKIIIICPIHGEFKQSIYNHIYGAGCPKCKHNYISNKFTSNTEEFIRKAKKIHGDKYDYNKVNYTKSRNPISIICEKHGEFIQAPSDHLQGCGCPKCKSEKISFISKRSQEVFIKEAKKIHNDRYCYDKTNYINKDSKVTITCSVHGDFDQIAHNHLKGQGCPRCKASKGELLIESILKKNNIVYETEYKLSEVKNRYEYDFYLPDYNLLIEFHGIQHYQYNMFFHKSYEEFLNRIIIDRIKEEEARAWGYKYLTIKYSVLNKLPKEKIEEQLLKVINRK